MQTIIGVRFKKAGKIFYFSPGNLTIAQGDDVVVETARGVECGKAVVGPREVEDSEIKAPLKVVLRIATENDHQRIEDNKKNEQEAFGICEAKIAEHGLPMKLVEVEYTFDLSKIIFYFTADGRIDFRDLVKDLASVFRTRIELRQVGVRDETKILGGYGSCGRPLCCHTWLSDFVPVSIKICDARIGSPIYINGFAPSKHSSTVHISATIVLDKVHITMQRTVFPVAKAVIGIVPAIVIPDAYPYH